MRVLHAMSAPKPWPGKGYTPVAKPDPRDPHPTRQGMFRLHNCARCSDGDRPCAQGDPRQCEYPHARND